MLNQICEIDYIILIIKLTEYIRVIFTDLLLY